MSFHLLISLFYLSVSSLFFLLVIREALVHYIMQKIIPANLDVNLDVIEDINVDVNVNIKWWKIDYCCGC